MLDAHLADIVEMFDVLRTGKGSTRLALLGGLDVLVRRKMIHDHGNLSRIEYLIESIFLKFLDGDRRCDVVAQHHIQLCFDQLTSLYLIQTGMCRQDLLCHCHSHMLIPFLPVHVAEPVPDSAQRTAP